MLWIQQSINEQMLSGQGWDCCTTCGADGGSSVGSVATRGSYPWCAIIGRVTIGPGLTGMVTQVYRLRRTPRTRQSSIVESVWIADRLLGPG